MPDRQPPIESTESATRVSVEQPAGPMLHPGGGEASHGEEFDELDQLLETSIQEYLEAAPLDSVAELQRFVPDRDANTQRFLLVELIKLDMAGRVESTPPSSPRIEDYLSIFSHLLGAADVPLDLVMEEVQLRKEAGESPDVQEYAKRFPRYESMVSELLGRQADSNAEATATVGRRERPPELQAGHCVDDFVIIQKLGSGAFANVYLARQESMSRLVALKVSQGQDDEPQALAQLDHPNIVRVFDQRILDDPSIHLLYMQFLPGGTLAEVIQLVRQTPPGKRSGDLILQAVDRSLLKTAQAVPESSTLRDELQQMSWPMAVAWLGLQLSRALDQAHRQGRMHRDVKPANVLLSAEGMPKLADFNVSFSGSAGRAGAASQFGGSIGYMAPEHLRAIAATTFAKPEQVGPEADLYSLAILLWELWQGERPFAVVDRPGSWTEAVQGQLWSRKVFCAPTHIGDDALDRLIETILRAALAYDPEKRIGSAAELERRLILAMHPEAVRLFDPDPKSWQGWLARRSPWLVASMMILVPNTIAGIYGYRYNHQDTLQRWFVEVEGLKVAFQTLATCINSIAFPLGVALVVYFTKRVIQGLRTTAAGQPASERALASSMELPHRAAMTGGLLWCVAAVLYPVLLSLWFPELSGREFGHFVLSHLICGGVAAIYPFFGLSVYVVSIVYPAMMRIQLSDSSFDRRIGKLTSRCERYLLLACLVPLVGAMLLLITEESAKHVMRIAIAASGLGLFAAFSAYRYIMRQCDVMTPILSGRRRAGLPL